MEMYWYIMVFVFGAIIGSFLNVVLYRFHTGKSLSGRSHCMSCEKTLKWYELFPIFSYLCLWGRCKGCSSRIPSRYAIVELCTGLLYVLVSYFSASTPILLILNLSLVTLFVFIVVYDMRHTIIPDEMSLGVGIIAILLLGYNYFLDRNIYEVLWHVGAGLGAGGFFAGLWYISKGRWIGFGDAKLALPLGMIVGIGSVFSFVVLSFWIGAIISLALISLGYIIKMWKTNLHFRTTQLTIQSEVPFAPFLISGFLVVYFFQIDIFRIIYALFIW